MKTDLYLKRLQFTTTPQPDLATLRALHYAHMLTVPFENLDVHLGRPLLIDKASLFEKIIEKRRGGMCYELNGIFYFLLQELGFDVQLISAEVFKEDGTTGPAFDHMALLVTIDAQPYLTDVGFGDSILYPLSLSDHAEHVQGNKKYQIQQHDNDYVLYAANLAENATLKPSFKFNTQPYTLADFGVMCHFHQTSAQSHFTQKEICSLATQSGRISLSGKKLIKTTAHSRELLSFNSEQDKAAALKQYFGIVL